MNVALQPASLREPRAQIEMFEVDTKSIKSCQCRRKEIVGRTTQIIFNEYLLIVR